ncbi:unnamed protein product [Closterium sp. NIES-53]
MHNDPGRANRLRAPASVRTAAIYRCNAGQPLCCSVGMPSTCCVGTSPFCSAGAAPIRNIRWSAIDVIVASGNLEAVPSRLKSRSPKDSIFRPGFVIHKLDARAKEQPMFQCFLFPIVRASDASTQEMQTLPHLKVSAVDPEHHVTRPVQKSRDLGDIFSGIEAAALGASESSLPDTAPAEALHTFTLDSGASRCLHLPSFFTNLVSTAALQDAMVTTTTPRGQRVSICTCTRMGRHLATFTRRPGSSLYTLATEPPQIAASAQVSASGPVAPPLLVSPPVAPDSPMAPLPWSPLPATPSWHALPPHCLWSSQVSASPPALACSALPSLRRGAAARRSSILLISPDDCSPADSPHGRDLLVLHLHSDRGGEFSSNLLRDFCLGEGILQSFTLPESPQQNGIAERRIGLVIEVARTSMIQAAAPHFIWPFAARYAAHQFDLWPRVSLPVTSLTLRWTGKVGDASVFQVWGSRAFFRDMSADKLSSCTLPCVFLGFPPAAPGYPLPGTVRVEVAVALGAVRGVASGGAEPVSAEPVGSEPAGADLGGAKSEGAESGGSAAGFGGTGGAGAAAPGGACTRGIGAAEAGGVGGAGTGGAGAGGAGAGGAGAGSTGVGGAGVGGAGVGAGGTGVGAGGTGAGGAGAGGAGAGDPGAGGTSTGGAGAGGVGAIDPGAGDPGAGGAGTRGAASGGTGAGGTVQRLLFFVPPPLLSLPPPDSVLRQVLSLPSSTGLPPSLLSPLPHHSQPQLQPDSPLPAPYPYAEKTDSFTEPREPESRPASHVRAVCTGRRIPRPRPPPVPSTHFMALRSSSSDCPPSVGGECALGTDVLEDRQEDFEYLAAAVPHLVAMLLAPAKDPDAPDIPTPRSHTEAITSPYSSQWQIAMDAEMASLKSTGTYIDADPPSGADIVDGTWTFRVKNPPGSPPVFKACYVARGFRQRQGVDFFQTFSLTPKMTTLWVLLHVTAQRDYELHSLDFNTAFLHGSLREEI